MESIKYLFPKIIATKLNRVKRKSALLTYTSTVWTSIELFPSRHMTLIQRRLNVSATSWHCIDVEPTLHKRHVPAGTNFYAAWSPTNTRRLNVISTSPWRQIARLRYDAVCLLCIGYKSGPSCSKLTMSLVNDSLKFTLSDTQICWIFLLKNVSSFCSAKATHIFSAKNIRILYIESAKTVK